MFKPTTMIIAAAMLIHTGAHADMNPQVNPYGKFYEGDGVEIEMAQFASKNADGLYDVLLKISGQQAFNAGIDGKTYRYQAVPGGNGVDYQRDGKTRMILRQPYGDWWTLAEVFLDGKTISISEKKDKSKEVRPLHLLTAFKENGK
ncbi:hypothetical protein [Chitinimonas sp.]|uniref:hypothetical protein n=1 Tax=Chitinimonas sp. TaxID=1934313 RepID=UPI0035B038ED